MPTATPSSVHASTVTRSAACCARFQRYGLKSDIVSSPNATAPAFAFGCKAFERRPEWRESLGIELNPAEFAHVVPRIINVELSGHVAGCSQLSRPPFVPAQAGIQESTIRQLKVWIPACAGNERGEIPATQV